MTRIGKKSERASAGDDDDIDDDESELFRVCSQIAAEDDLLAPIHEALTLWESCLQATSSMKDSLVFCDRKLDWTVSLDYLEVLVMIYKLTEVSIFRVIFVFFICFAVLA